MKICSFCNRSNPNEADKCVSCGGNTFKYKCDNCGTEFTEGLHCPHCGVKVGQQIKVCPKCHTNYYTNACPNCGFTAVGNSNASVNYRPQSYTAPQKQKTLLWVLGWIFIFPLPLTLILLKKPDMNKKVKYGIIIGVWAAYLIIALIYSANSKENKKFEGESTNNSTVISTEATTAPASEKETLEEITEKPTEKPTKAVSGDPTESTTSIYFTDYTDSVEAGSIAFVTIQGKPNTEYSIRVWYDTTASTAEGLKNKISDDYGYVTWEWKVGANTTPGEHNIEVSGGGDSAETVFNVYN